VTPCEQTTIDDADWWACKRRNERSGIAGSSTSAQTSGLNQTTSTARWPLYLCHREKSCQWCVIVSNCTIGPRRYRYIVSYHAISPQKRSGMARVIKFYLPLAHLPRKEWCRCQSSFTDPGGMEGWVGLGITTVKNQMLKPAWASGFKISIRPTRSVIHTVPLSYRFRNKCNRPISKNSTHTEPNHCLKWLVLCVIFWRWYLRYDNDKR